MKGESEKTGQHLEVPIETDHFDFDMIIDMPWNTNGPLSQIRVFFFEQMPRCFPGIEFKELEAPFVVEQVHEHGLAPWSERAGWAWGPWFKQVTCRNFVTQPRRLRS